MQNIGSASHSDFTCGITFDSYGVTIRLESDRKHVLDRMEMTAREALLGNFEIIDNEAVPIHQLGIKSDGEGVFAFFRDFEHLTNVVGEDESLEMFIRLLRLKVSEFAQDFVFVHAGVVGWKEKAVIIPADSGKGKTSLVIELVKRGASYYSDEYAVLDKDGLVHPFARKLSVRAPGTVWSEKNGIPVEEFGGKAAEKPIEVGLALFAEYEPNGSWSPEILSTGVGMMEALNHTIPLRVNTEFSLNVLKNALSRAIILRSPRGEASETAKYIISIIEDGND